METTGEIFEAIIKFEEEVVKLLISYDGQSSNISQSKLKQACLSLLNLCNVMVTKIGALTNANKFNDQILQIRNSILFLQGKIKGMVQNQMHYEQSKLRDRICDLVKQIQLLRKKCGYLLLFDEKTEEIWRNNLTIETIKILRKQNINRKNVHLLSDQDIQYLKIPTIGDRLILNKMRITKYQ